MLYQQAVDGATMENVSISSVDDCNYKILAMVPRGLQEDIVHQIICHSSAAETMDSNSVAAITTTMSLLDQTVYQEYGKRACEKFVKQQKLKEQRRKDHQHNVKKGDIKTSESEKRKKKKHQQNPKQKWDLSRWFRFPVGTIGIDPTANGGGDINDGNGPDVFVSFGYNKNDQQTIPSSPDVASVPSNIPWTGPGQLFGSVWLQVNNSSLLKLESICSLRCLGPILSLIQVGSLRFTLSGQERSPSRLTEEAMALSLEEITKRFKEWVTSNDATYTKDFRRALDVWKYHVQSSWKDQLFKQYQEPCEENKNREKLQEQYEKLQERIESNQLRFRVSCVRELPTSAGASAARKRRRRKKNKQHNKQSPTINNDSTLTTAPVDSANTTTADSTPLSPVAQEYNRQDIVTSIMDTSSRELIPYYDGGTGNADDSGHPPDNKNRNWQVDLTNFDIELVIILTAQLTVAIGISLNPYSYLKSKSFEIGVAPPDVTSPYIGGNILSGGIVRLRPTTAHTLLKIANCQPYEIVLDPCAGIGTIPIEADMYFSSDVCNRERKGRRIIGFGGDIVLHEPQISTAAAAMAETAAGDVATSSTGRDVRAYSLAATTTSSMGSSLLAAWDATFLPVRSGCVDAVVSDLPFGQQCLSAGALTQLLPLIMRQCARVLSPNTGRMVVLCGSPSAICTAIEESSTSIYWVQPCTRITPMTVGGLVAWIVRVERNHVPFVEDGAIEEQFRARIRKVASKRDRASEFQKTTPENDQMKKRRLQS